jgi:hypothetical protein
MKRAESLLLDEQPRRVEGRDREGAGNTAPFLKGGGRRRPHRLEWHGGRL